MFSSLANTLTCFLAFSSLDEPPEQPCAEKQAPVVVDTATRKLFLCREGKSEARFEINLGAGGVDKKRLGDRKTPLGLYPLAAPRASVSGFTWFIGVGYPTAEQKRKGLTGGSIGIHGPPDWMPEFVVRAAFKQPWTDGCIMVATRAEIDQIRAWVLKHQPKHILIH